VWLNLENEFNQAHLLEQGFDAQWNDDGHNTLHVLLTGETDAYYSDFATEPTQKLARLLTQGFVYQGEATRHGHTRGEPSGHLPPSAFVLFLQNHDQIGNRAFGERLPALCPAPALKAATALLLLSPMIPLMFMGDEWAASEPFLFFTSHHGELADAVREGRRSEFADFAAFADEKRRETIPDPNDPRTFEASRPAFDAVDLETDIGLDHRSWLELYRELLALRHQHIVPRLPGAHALGTDILRDGAVSARWRMGDGSVLRIDLNLTEHPAAAPALEDGALLFASHANSVELSRRGTLNPYTAVVSLTASDVSENRG
jgi:maltooligosyltrehalose trehalohydrolase